MMPNPSPHQDVVASPNSLELVEHSSIPVYHVVTYSQTGHSRPHQFLDYVTYYSSHPPLNLFHTVAIPHKPKTSTQAISKPKWCAAMEFEFKALLDNGTWSLCPRPSSHHIVHNKCVYKIKQKLDGSIDHYKARLVTKGFDQRSGVDYFEAFSLFVKPTAVRIIFAWDVQFH